MDVEVLFVKLCTGWCIMDGINTVLWPDLLKSKLNSPCVNNSLIVRPQLMDQLDKFFYCKLLVVNTPAGYGKTTALAEWIRRRKVKCCWLSLDQADNEPVLFCRYLSASLEPVSAGLHKRLNKILLGPDSQSAKLLATVVSQEIALFQSDFLLFLDNYHVIEQPLIHDIIALLLKLAPDRMHIIISSRTELPMVLSRYHMQGQIMELQTKDFQFSTNEIVALCRSKNISIDKDDVQMLEKVTEGWAVGLHIATLTLNGAKGSFQGCGDLFADNFYMEDYFNTEVFEELPGSIQEFLLQSSILNRITAPLCDAIVRREDSHQVLSFLNRNSVFIVPMDKDGQWFRYHRLFRDFLRKKLKQDYVALLHALHLRAAEWFVENGILTEAIHHALQGKGYTRAADLIVEQAKTSLKYGKTRELLGWLNALPQPIIDDNLLLGLAYTWAMLLTGNFEAYQIWLNKMESYEYITGKYPNHLAANIKNELIIMRAAAASFMGDIEKCIALNREAQGHGSIFIGNGIEFNSGEAHLLTRRVKIPLDQVLDFALKMNSMWADIGEVNGVWSVVLGELLYERNDLDNALNLLVEGIGHAERTKSSEIFIAGSITLARIARAKGNLDGAFEIISRTEEQIKEFNSMDWLRLLAAFRVWLWVNCHDDQSISAWLTKCSIVCNDRENQLVEYEQIARIRALQELGRFDESARLLQQCLVVARSEHRLPSLVVILTLRAVARHRLGDMEGALFSLREALTIAQRDGYMRSIIDEGMPIIALLRHFLASPVTQKDAALTDFVQRLLRQVNNHVVILKVAVRSLPSASTGEKITRREQQMLCLLETGQANAEIAIKTGVSINTVKRHIRSLYRKMGARNRVQAIKRAREMQLI